MFLQQLHTSYTNEMTTLGAFLNKPRFIQLRFNSAITQNTTDTTKNTFLSERRLFSSFFKR